MLLQDQVMRWSVRLSEAIRFPTHAPNSENGLPPHPHSDSGSRTHTAEAEQILAEHAERLRQAGLTNEERLGEDVDRVVGGGDSGELGELIVTTLRVLGFVVPFVVILLAAGKLFKAGGGMGGGGGGGKEFLKKSLLGLLAGTVIFWLPELLPVVGAFMWRLIQLGFNILDDLLPG